MPKIDDLIDELFTYLNSLPPSERLSLLAIVEGHRGATLKEIRSWSRQPEAAIQRLRRHFVAETSGDSALFQVGALVTTCALVDYAFVRAHEATGNKARAANAAAKQLGVKELPALEFSFAQRRQALEKWQALRTSTLSAKAIRDAERESLQC